MTERIRFGLVSERALDSLNICGIKAKSQGKLSASREYNCCNGTKVRLLRPFIEGAHEEITQGDLDILRAVNAKYIQEEVRYPFIQADITPIVGDDSPVSQLNTVPPGQLRELIASDQAVPIAITPEEIRKRMGMNKQCLPTPKIQRALTKISGLKVRGTYKARSADGVKDVPIDGNLFEFVMLPAANHSFEFCLIFASKWGRLYLHNLHSGNVAAFTDSKYSSLSHGAKTVLTTVLAMPNPLFYRRVEDMIEVMNIKVGKNFSRARANLKKYLDELAAVGYASWTEANGVYTVKRQMETGLKGIKFAQSGREQKEHVGPTSPTPDSPNGHDAEILDLVAHYNMVARRHLHTVEYYALSTARPTEDEKWKYFAELRNMCDGLKWDAKLYIEAQFSRCRNWHNAEVAYPLPHMLGSEAARDRFLKYQEDWKGLHRYEKHVPLPTQSIEEEIDTSLARSVRDLNEMCRRWGQSNQETPNQLGLRVSICHSIWSRRSRFSPYYLYSIPWFHRALYEEDEKYDRKDEKRFKSYFKSIQTSNKWQEYITERAKYWENEYSIPPHIDPTDPQVSDFLEQ